MVRGQEVRGPAMLSPCKCWKVPLLAKGLVRNNPWLELNVLGDWAHPVAREGSDWVPVRFQVPDVRIGQGPPLNRPESVERIGDVLALLQLEGSGA